MASRREVAFGIAALALAALVTAVFIARRASGPGRSSPAPAAGRGVAAHANGGTSDTGVPAVDTALDSAVSNALGDSGQAPLRAQKLDTALLREREHDKRLKIISSLSPYCDRAAEMKARVAAMFGDITAAKIPELVAYASDMEESFWSHGDFDNIAAFEDIYMARAALEMCLEADPYDEKALTTLAEVLQAGWPYFLTFDEVQKYSRAEPRTAESVLFARNNEGYEAVRGVLLTLWEKHISVRENPTLDDLNLANGLLTMGFSKAQYDAAREAFLKQHPGASAEEAAGAERAAVRDLQTAILKWSIAQCDRRAPEWDYYRKTFLTAQESLPEKGFLVPPPPLLVPGYEPGRLSIRYGTGRLFFFRGPRRRAQCFTPVHEVLKGNIKKAYE